MKEGITFIVEIINNFHDVLIAFFNSNGLTLTDKDLHFWIMGIIGITVYMFVYIVSKWLSKVPFGIAGLSFLYTLTFMFVLVFAIEIQQAITNRGNMEFIDAVIGLWGFVLFFIVYVAIVMTFLIAKSVYKKYAIKNNDESDHTI